MIEADTTLAAPLPRLPMAALYDATHSATDGIRVVLFQQAGGQMHVHRVIDHRGEGVVAIQATLPEVDEHMLGRGFVEDHSNLRRLADVAAERSGKAFVVAGELLVEQVLRAAGATADRPVSRGFESRMEELLAETLQQAHALTAFLPGGDAFDTVVSDHTMTPEDAAAELRQRLGEALEILGIEP